MSEQEATASVELIASAKHFAENEISFPHVTQMQMAWQDIQDGLQKWPIWVTLAYQDIKVRYRRSVLGPFWLTLSMAITVYSMGFLYAHLFHSEVRQYYPFLVAGMVSWGLIAAAISELTDTFAGAEGIKQIKMPYSLYIHRTISRNIIIFFHNILVMIPIYIIFHDFVRINLNTLILIPGLMLTYLNAMIFGLILAMIGARFRDISQIIKSLIQVIFFVTPIMWDPKILPEKDIYFVLANPFYSYIELIRAPLLGLTPTLTNWMITLSTTIVGSLICMLMFSRYRARIIYWL
jgi:lipopolysaccharide transport system permease protein